MSTHVFPSSFRRKPGWHLHCEEERRTEGKATVQATYFIHPLPENSSLNLIAFRYLEAYSEVLAELGAATQFAVQALINEAAQLVRAIAAVVLVVTEQCLIDAVSIVAGKRGVVAFLLCSVKKRHGKQIMRKCQPVQLLLFQSLGINVRHNC